MSEALITRRGGGKAELVFEAVYDNGSYVTTIAQTQCTLYRDRLIASKGSYANIIKGDIGIMYDENDTVLGIVTVASHNSSYFYGNGLDMGGTYFRTGNILRVYRVI